MYMAPIEPFAQRETRTNIEYQYCTNVKFVLPERWVISYNCTYSGCLLRFLFQMLQKVLVACFGSVKYDSIPFEHLCYSTRQPYQTTVSLVVPDKLRIVETSWDLLGLFGSDWD